MIFHEQVNSIVFVLLLFWSSLGHLYHDMMFLVECNNIFILFMIILFSRGLLRFVRGPVSQGTSCGCYRYRLLCQIRMVLICLMNNIDQKLHLLQHPLIQRQISLLTSTIIHEELLPQKNTTKNKHNSYLLKRLLKNSIRELLMHDNKPSRTNKKLTHFSQPRFFQRKRKQI